MTSKATTVPEKRNMGVLARRLVLFDNARGAVGGGAFARALGVSSRAIRHKLSVDRGLSDHDLLMAALAVERRIEQLQALAIELRAIAS